MKYTFGYSVDTSFEKILNIIRTNVLCNYRNILHVYSQPWVSIEKTDGIQISKTRKRNVSPFKHNAYSIVVTKLLRKWIKNINYVSDNIESKYI